MRQGTGKDDPALAETTWPMPDGERFTDAVWRLLYASPSDQDRVMLAAMINAYVSLITDSTTTQQTKRLAALRRVYRRRRS